MKMTSPIESGYVSEKVRWADVIDCWQTRVEGSFKPSKDPMSSMWANWKKNQVHAPELERRIKSVEEKLGASLPKSYRDFLASSNGRVQRKGAWGESDALFRAVDEIGWYKNAMPDAAAIWRTGGDSNVSDADYFAYDVRQYHVSFRPQYIDKLLLIGHRSESTDILLNSAVQTPDGEWEAWVLGPGIPGAIRYPSFAHLMRDVILTDLTDPKSEGPYPDNLHRGSCSELIKIKPVF